MPSVLWNVLRFSGLAIGVPSVQAHQINLNGRAIVPSDVRLSGGGYSVSVDDTNVTITRQASGAAAVDVEVLKYHSIQDAEPLPNGIATSVLPFVMQGVNSAGGGVAVAAGTQTAATGTVAFSNSNGLSFGMSGSSQVTASMDAFRSIIAGGTAGTATGPSFSFSNGNGVTFGINGTILTASVQTVGGTATGVGISAGTQVATTGAVVFSDSNQISFGMNASTVTATFAAIKTISASGGSITNGQASFANSNSVTFGINGGTVTASVSLPAVQTVIGFTATGGETQITVTFAAVANTRYAVAAMNAGLSRLLVWDCPKGSRSTTAFVAIPSGSMVSNDAMEFGLFANT